MEVCGVDGPIVSDRKVSSFSSSSLSSSLEAAFGFIFAREGEDMRDRFYPDPPSGASDPFVGVDRVIFSANLKLISLTIAQASIVSKVKFQRSYEIHYLQT